MADDNSEKPIDPHVSLFLKRHGPPIEGKADLFAQCPECGDWFDPRQSRDVFLHAAWHAAGHTGLMPGHQRH
jgi:hypothetical protein